MTEPDARTPPSVNGTGRSRDDFHTAGKLLYGELSQLPWFVGIEFDEDHERFLIEVKDIKAAREYLGDRRLFGWTTEIRPTKAMVH